MLPEICIYILSDMVNRANSRLHTNSQVLAVENRFFGPSVTVAGLTTGSDIIMGIQGKSLGDALLIPESMLRKGQDVFLDDVTVSELSQKAGIPVIPVPVRGDLFLRALLGEDFREVT